MSVPAVAPIALPDIYAARDRIADAVLRTPLVPFGRDLTNPKIFLKLENLQPIGSFKLRGAQNAVSLAADEIGRDGVFTASAGNWAQGLAWAAHRLDLRCDVVVPEHAPRTKTAAIERLGAHVIRVPFDDWWQVIVTHRFAGLTGRFFHPVSDPAVIAGNGTIGLEILEDLPSVRAVVIPFGGGGLSSGIATAVRALRPEVRIYASEIETAAPLAASLAAGEPRTVEHSPSFVDGIGGKSVLAEMWPLVRSLIDESIVVSLEETASAIRALAKHNHVIAEGAGATALAAALSERAGSGPIACVISGGNIDSDTLDLILAGRIP